MVITATYSDSSTADITGYTVPDGNNLTAGKETVTISYTLNGVTRTTTQSITVSAASLTGISVTTPPDRTNYTAAPMNPQWSI